MNAEHDLGAIVRVRSETFLRTRRTTAAQRTTLRVIGACRTPALGGQRQQCDRCGHEHIQWHFCRNRSCPRCGAAARARWLATRWRQTLTLHPHIHCVVPGGGFSVDGRQWHSTATPTFFLPVRVLSRRFRSLLVRSLREAWREGTLELPEGVIADSVALDLAPAGATDWVVYCEPPFGGPDQVLELGARDRPCSWADRRPA